MAPQIVHKSPRCGHNTAHEIWMFLCNDSNSFAYVHYYRWIVWCIYRPVVVAL